MFKMKFFVAAVLLATCLAAQAKSIPYSPAITLLDFYKHNSNGAGRIISGQPSKSGQFPYQAAIFMNWPNGQQSFCGGTLISSKWILTAAHCADGVASWDIKLGGVRIDTNEPGQVVQRSYKGIVHPGYNEYVNNDIALIELPSAVSFTDKIQPLRLPRRSEAGDRLENIRVRVSGWGKISDSAPGASSYMSYVDMDTITNSKCAEVYGPWVVIDSTICCKGRPEHSPCSGDSGGPLVRTAEDGELTHIGVVSFVHVSGCASGNPSAYVRSASFLDWINQHTGIPIRP